MKIHESGENYLETIFLLKKNKEKLHSIDIANELNYTKASISRAIGLLKKAGFITVDGEGHIQFTPSGYEKAKGIYERHEIITRFFMLTLNIEKELAETEACRIEHILSGETFLKIKEYVRENGAKI